MIERSPLDWLNDAKRYALEAKEIVRHLDQAGYDRNRRDQLAVQFCLAAVGEALNQISDDIRALAPDIPWTAINGLRNRLVHAFFLIDNQIILNIARSDTEALAASLDRLINKVK
jgi:uncharacterized protein with HEPN domain